jgi:hypothetical protein
MSKKKIVKPKKVRKIILDQIDFEIFEVAMDASFENEIHGKLILENTKTFLMKNTKIKEISLRDKYSLTTPEGEGAVLAEIIRVLIFVYGNRTLSEMMSSLDTFLRETRLNDASDYQSSMPNGYINRFFEYDPDGRYKTFKKALEEAQNWGDYSGLREKKDSKVSLNPYEEEEFGWSARWDYVSAGIYNHVLNVWSNSELEEILFNYYFIA